ncbi:ABC transporter substrate-binding protein [Oceanisphaera sp.]|uniref:ABC transporter substrate-binding protein n=1 Tax=Oceanisphaera sp. TaxID=1929979 RepID=UPI003A8F5E5D
MTPKKNDFAMAVLAASLLMQPTHALAAEVPAGAILAQQQHLVKDNGAEPATLDPHKTEGVPGANVQRDLFEGLVISGPKGETLPGVATHWDTDDNMRFTFHLRPEAKWSNGDPVTARDFEYSFKRAINPATASPYAWYLEIPTIINAAAILKGEKEPEQLGVKALDEHTLEIRLEHPVPYFVTMLAHTTTYPVHRKAIEQHGDNWTRPGNLISNGAYTLSSWVVNERIELERNPHYWNDKQTVVDRVSYLPISSQNAAMNRFLAGEIHLTNDMPIEHFKRLSQQHPEEVRITGYVGTYYYLFNTQKPPFDDVRVRKALSYSIDRHVIANLVMGQGQLPGYTMTPEIVDGFTPPSLAWANWTQTQRDDTARELLEQAGFNKQNPLKFELLYNTSENHKKVAVAIASMWKKSLGAEAELVNQEWKTYLDTKTQGNFDVARAGWIADYNEASSMLDLLQSTHGNNDGKYSSLKYDQLMKATRAMVDADARNAKYTQAEEILAEDMPIAPIYQYVTARLVQQHVGGYPENPLDNLYSKDMYILAH